MLNPDLRGLVPAPLAAPRLFKVSLIGFELSADIGFHDHEVGAPQRFRIDCEIWLDPALLPRQDSVEEAWNYDFLRTEIRRLVETQRWNLQESLGQAIYQLIAARLGVAALRVRTAKPDIYPDCETVSVELASFAGAEPAHGPIASSAAL